MNRDEGMQKVNEAHAGRAARSWERPQVVRLQAGQAEQTFRLVVSDGPLTSFS